MKKCVVFLYHIIFCKSAFSQVPMPVVQDGHARDVKIIAMSPNGFLFATGGLDNIIILWDTKNQGQIARYTQNIEIESDSIKQGQIIQNSGFRAMDSDFEFVADRDGLEISAISIDKRNGLLAFGNKRGDVFCYDIITKDLVVKISLKEYTEHSGSIRKLFFSGNSRFLIVQAKDFRVYDLLKKTWVMENKQIVASDYSEEEAKLYVVQKKNGALLIEQCKMPLGDTFIVDWTLIDNVLFKELYRKKKLIKELSEEKLQFSVLNKGDMAFLYGNTLRWKSENAYYTRRGDNWDLGNSQFCFLGNKYIAFSGDKSIMVWKTKGGKPADKILGGLIMDKVLCFDKRNNILLTAYAKKIQSVNINTGRSESIGLGNHTITNISFGVDKKLYIESQGLANGFGVRTFNNAELPFKASYIAGSQRYYKTGNHHQLTLTRTNKILLSDENGFVMKRKNIDSRITIQKVFMPLVYPIFIMGGNYSVVRTTPWNLAQIGRSVYSDKNNLLMYNSWLDSRTEVVEVNKLKKRRRRLHLTDVTSMSISANQQLFASAGKRCRMCDKRYVYIYKIEGINKRRSKPILRIVDSSTNIVENLVFSGNSILAAGTKTLISQVNPNNPKRIITSEKRSIRFFDVSSGKQIGMISKSIGPMVFMNNGKLFLFASDRALNLYSFDSLRIVKSWKAHNDKITSVLFDSVRNQVITSSLDGSIRYWNALDFTLTASLYQIKNEYILLTPDGYYMSSKSGTAAVGYGVGNRFVTFEQFDIRYNRPDIVLSRLGWFSNDVTNALNFAYQKRLKHFKKDSSQFYTSLKDLPLISVNNKFGIQQETSGRNLLLKYSVVSGLDKVQWIKAELNDVPIYGSHGLNVGDKKLDSLAISFALDPGENLIKLYAVTVKGYESIREVIKIKYIPKRHEKIESKVWTVHIGISKFKDSSWNLRYAEKDAIDLKKYYTAIKRSHSILLTNEKVTRKNILALRDTLMKTGIDDKVIVSYSGHGIISKEKDYFLSTYDVDFDNPIHNGITYEEFMSILDSIPARKKLVFLDACHSGEFDKEDIDVQSKKDTSTLAVIDVAGTGKNAIVGGIKKSATGGSSSFELMQELFVNLENGSGAIVLSASTGIDVAYENNKWNNGALTYCILNGLQDKKADKNRNKKIEISELKSYILNEVPKLTNGKQKPTFRRENENTNWYIN